ncbi:hypothetical protein AB0E69_08575 [Kribbella sp. NPDC026611]|uniref:hypothetical protein n=1 Tax=Kribbella sp. NPDC026611 TaxID=3154911 RepID=UPI00340BC30D
MNTILETIKSLDPADPTAGSHTPRAHADLQRILHTPRDLPARPRVRRRRLVLAGGVAVVMAAGAFVVPSVTGGDKAFATWTAQPTGMAAGERADAAASCRKHQASGSPEYREQVAGATAAIAERRGNWTLVALAGQNGFSALCITDDSRPIFRSMIGSLGTTTHQPGPRGLTAVNLGMGMLNNRSLSVAAGFAGAEVAAVSYLSPTKGKVAATVSAEQFALWLPGNDLDHASRTGVPLQVSYRDGTTATVTVKL